MRVKLLEFKNMFKKILVSRYQLIKLLGKGTFGKTYLAKDLLLPDNPLCAIKKLNPVNKDDNSLNIARRLFNTEAESLQKLGEHPQIPRFLGFFEEKNEFYLVQQFIEGHSLSEEITPEKYWSELDVVELMRDCLNILKFIHSQNVIHRDIKPDNLIRNKKDNKLVLVDFGAVKETISQSKVSSTIAIGTHGYMPSEQAMGKPRFNSDIYAVGIIAIQALTGIEPQTFREDNSGNIIWYGQENVNPKLVKIIKKMTRYHFKDRYSSVEKVLQDLNSLDLGYQGSKRNGFFGLNALVERVKSNRKTVIDSDSLLSSILPKTNNPKIPMPTTVVNYQQPTKYLNRFKFKSPLSMGMGSLATLGLLVLGGVQFASHHKQQKIASLLDLMRANYQHQEYDLCLKNARVKALEVGLSTDKVQEFIGKCSLASAHKEAEAGNYSEAIAKATEIPANNPFAPEAKENIDRWSEILLDRATKIYEKEGQLAKVTPLIDTIPNNSSVKEKALKLNDKWQGEINNSEQLLADADRAMTAKKWLDAIDRANKVKTVSNSIYWQGKADKIISEAKGNREKELAAARQRAIQTSRSPVPRYNSYNRTTYKSPVVRQQPTTRYRRRVRVRRTVITTETRYRRRVVCRGYKCTSR